MNSKLKYKEYLKSHEWQQTRLDIITIRKCCDRCGSKESLQVHHNNYKRIGREEPTDLELLCYKCHYFEHEKAILFKTKNKDLNKWQRKRKRIFSKPKKKKKETLAEKVDRIKKAGGYIRI